MPKSRNPFFGSLTSNGPHRPTQRKPEAQDCTQASASQTASARSEADRAPTALHSAQSPAATVNPIVPSYDDRCDSLVPPPLRINKASQPHITDAIRPPETLPKFGQETRGVPLRPARPTTELLATSIGDLPLLPNLSTNDATAIQEAVELVEEHNLSLRKPRKRKHDDKQERRKATQLPNLQVYEVLGVADLLRERNRADLECEAAEGKKGETIGEYRRDGRITQPSQTAHECPQRLKKTEDRYKQRKRKGKNQGVIERAEPWDGSDKYSGEKISPEMDNIEDENANEKQQGEKIAEAPLRDRQKEIPPLVVATSFSSLHEAEDDAQLPKCPPTPPPKDDKKPLPPTPLAKAIKGIRSKDVLKTKIIAKKSKTTNLDVSNTQDIPSSAASTSMPINRVSYSSSESATQHMDIQHEAQMKVVIPISLDRFSKAKAHFERKQELAEENLQKAKRESADSSKTSKRGSKESGKRPKRGSASSPKTPNRGSGESLRSINGASAQTYDDLNRTSGESPARSPPLNKIKHKQSKRPLSADPNISPTRPPLPRPPHTYDATMDLAKEDKIKKTKGKGKEKKDKAGGEKEKKDKAREEKKKEQQQQFADLKLKEMEYKVQKLEQENKELQRKLGMGQCQTLGKGDPATSSSNSVDKDPCLGGKLPGKRYVIDDAVRNKVMERRERKVRKEKVDDDEFTVPAIMQGFYR